MTATIGAHCADLVPLVAHRIPIRSEALKYGEKFVLTDGNDSEIDLSPE
jgi:hypothetical protein